MKERKIILRGICFLRLDENNTSTAECALRDLVFANISDTNASIWSSPLVTPDKHHPPIFLYFDLTLDCHFTSLTPHRSYVQGDDYLLLRNILRHSDWSCILKKNSADLTVNNLIAIVRGVLNLSISYIKSKNSVFLHWLSTSLNIILRRESSTSEDTRNQNLVKSLVCFLIIVNWFKPQLKQTGFAV